MQSLVAMAMFAAVCPVIAQTRIGTGHVDIGVAFENGMFDLHIHDETTDTEFTPEEAILQVRTPSLTAIPPDPRFSFLGTTGSPIWILPQIERDDLLFLGIGAEEIGPGVFTQDQLRVTLKGISGPGHFYLYGTGGVLGDPVVRMNSRDGILDGSDFVSLQTGGHTDLNWAFTAPGIYTVSLEASGTLITGNQNVTSGLVDYTFEIIPEPRTMTLGALGALTLLGAALRKKTVTRIFQ